MSAIVGTAMDVAVVALDASALISPIFKLLTEIKAKYDGVKEASKLCEGLHNRLTTFATELSTLSDDAMRLESLLPQLQTLVEEFAASVTTFASKNFVKRLLKMDAFKEDVVVFNERLDGLIKLISVKHVGRFAELLQWRDQYQHDAALVATQLTEMKQLQYEIWNALEELRHQSLHKVEEVRLVAMRDVANANTQQQDHESTSSVLNKVVAIAEEHFLQGQPLSSPPAWLIAADEVTIVGKPIDTENMTTIYRAKWQGSVVAVKKFGVIQETRAYEKHFAVWRTLLHPHVAQLYGTGSEDGAPFFVYEYASHQSLDKCWDKLTPREILQCLYHAALALAYLHSKRVVHGNMSCSKVLVFENATAKVYGFGASYVRVGDASNSLKVDTSEEFAAPECVGIVDGMRHSPSIESDVYSFGLTILEAVIKNDPFNKMNSKGIRKWKQQDEPTLPDGVDVGDDRVWALVAQMCQRDPSQRVSVAYVVEQLEELMKNPAAQP